MNDHIEDYFNQDLPPPEKAKFEEDLRQNPQLQEEVAFYLKTKQVLREQPWPNATPNGRSPPLPKPLAVGSPSGNMPLPQW